MDLSSPSDFAVIGCHPQTLMDNVAVQVIERRH